MKNSVFYFFYPGQWKNSKTLNNFFLELEYFCKYTHNKMSNQESEDVLYWRLGKLDCNATMGNEQLGILHHPQNRSFGNTEESTFELLAIGHHEY